MATSPLWFWASEQSLAHFFDMAGGEYDHLESSRIFQNLFGLLSVVNHKRVYVGNGDHHVRIALVMTPSPVVVWVSRDDLVYIVKKFRMNKSERQAVLMFNSAAGLFNEVEEDRVRFNKDGAQEIKLFVKLVREA